MLYSVLFRFGHIRRSDQCAVYILYSKISTDPGLPLKIRHSHRFVAVVIQFLIPLLFVCLFVLFCSLTMNEKFQYRTRPPSAALKIFDNDVKEVVAS